MLRERNFISISFGLLTIGLLHQLLLHETTRANTEIHNQEPPSKPQPPETTTTTTTLATTTHLLTTKPTTKTTTTTTVATTTGSSTCWLKSNKTSSEACFRCNICTTGLSSGAIAGIVIAVLLFYLISLILVAILVSVLTKRGTLDPSKWRIFQLISNRDKAKINAELAVENTYSEESPTAPTSPAEMYITLDARTREVKPPEASPYEALQMGGPNNRNLKPKVKKKPKTSAPKATDDEIYQNY